jgi:hypothetical protein
MSYICQIIRSNADRKIDNQERVETNTRAVRGERFERLFEIHKDQVRSLNCRGVEGIWGLSLILGLAMASS